MCGKLLPTTTMTVVVNTSTMRFYPTTPWMQEGELRAAMPLLLLRNRVGNLNVEVATQHAVTNPDSPNAPAKAGSPLSANGYVLVNRLTASGGTAAWVRFGFFASATSGVARGEVSLTVATTC